MRRMTFALLCFCCYIFLLVKDILPPLHQKNLPFSLEVNTLSELYVTPTDINCTVIWVMYTQLESLVTFGMVQLRRQVH